MHSPAGALILSEVLAYLYYKLLRSHTGRLLCKCDGPGTGHDCCQMYFVIPRSCRGLRLQEYHWNSNDKLIHTCEIPRKKTQPQVRERSQLRLLLFRNGENFDVLVVLTYFVVSLFTRCLV